MVTIGKNATIVGAVADMHMMYPGGILGSWLMALIVQTFSLGLMASQVAYYVSAFPNDTLWLKAVVWAVVVLSILQWALSVTTAWSWFVASYGDWITVATYAWHLCAQPPLYQFLISISQSCFVHRCYILSRRSKLVLIFLTLPIVISSILFSSLSYVWATDPYNLKVERMIVAPGLVLNLATDVAIALLSSYYLTRSSAKAFNVRTDAVVQRLVGLIWEAAIPPVLAATLNLAFWWISGDHDIVWGFFSLLTVRLYAFSLMYTLNSRVAVRQTLQGIIPVSGRNCHRTDTSGQAEKRNSQQSANTNTLVTSDFKFSHPTKEACDTLSTLDHHIINDMESDLVDMKTPDTHVSFSVC